jgi:hypothetical protein
MSDITFSSALVRSAPAIASPGLVRRFVVRARRATAGALDINQTYGVVEAVCLLVACGFGSAVVAMAFGLHI